MNLSSYIHGGKKFLLIFPGSNEYHGQNHFNLIKIFHASFSTHKKLFPSCFMFFLCFFSKYYEIKGKAFNACQTNNKKI